MKCPKCGYLGFEQVDRCRNCGYEFRLAESAPLPELPLHDRRATPVNPLDDLSFLKEPETGFAASSSREDLPLFSESIPDDEPLITKASPPRQPLAVRRATAEVPRLRAEPRLHMFDLAFESEPVTPTPVRAPIPVPATHSSRRERPAQAGRRDDVAASEAASLGARFVAAVIDLVILAVVDVLVVYLTMQICGVTFLDFAVLPKGPLLAFLLVQNGGYLAAFTAGGQTLGKMAMGIRVVAADETQALDLGRAILRTLLWLVLVIPGGLGFLTALLSRDHRGLHDRVAGTRVVRAPV
jgi:uncharacterized RDD family membrane protein YckC